MISITREELEKVINRLEMTKKTVDKKFNNRKYRFSVTIENGDFDDVIDILRNQLEDYEMDDRRIIGDYIMKHLYHDDVSNVDNEFKRELIYVNERVKAIMLTYVLLRREDVLHWCGNDMLETWKLQQEYAERNRGTDGWNLGGWYYLNSAKEHKAKRK